MNKTWSLVQLSDVFDIARGGSPRPIQRYLTDDPKGVNWIMIGDAEDGAKYITSTKKRIIPEGVSRSRTVQEGDFLLTNSMSFGKPYIMKTSGCIHDGWLVLSPKSNEIDVDYFYHLLGSKFVYAEFARRAAGATVKNLNIKLVKGIKVPLPPLEEQRRIAAILDTADTLRTKRRQAIAKLDTLLQSTFLTMFGDPDIGLVPIEKAMSRIIDYRGKTPPKTDVGVPLVTAKIVNDGYISTPTEFIAVDYYDTWMRRGLPLKGDVVFTTEAPLGKVAQLSTEKVALAQRIVLLRGKPGMLDNKYLMHALTAPIVKQQIEKRSTGSTVKGIRQKELRKVEIPVPSIELQLEFNAIASGIDTERERSHISLRQLENLFLSLQQRAFRGDL